MSVNLGDICPAPHFKTFIELGIFRNMKFSTCIEDHTEGNIKKKLYYKRVLHTCNVVIHVTLNISS